MRFVTNLFASSVLHFRYGGVDVACEIFFPLILRNNRPMDYTSERKIFNSARFANTQKHIKDAANSSRFISSLEWLHPALFSIAGCHAWNNFQCVQIFFGKFSTDSPGTATQTLKHQTLATNWSLTEQLFLEALISFELLRSFIDTLGKES